MLLVKFIFHLVQVRIAIQINVYTVRGDLYAIFVAYIVKISNSY